MKRTLNKVLSFFSTIPMPIVLLGVCVLAYGLLVPWLGFYLDDWYIVLFQKYFGSGNFSQFFKADRPLFAFVYNVFVPLFKDSKLGWQIFAVIAHTLAASIFWWLLTKILPERRKLTAVIALFFAIYPGFQVHWFSVLYSQVFMLYAIYFLSYVLMFDAIRAKKGKIWFWMGALICQLIGIAPQETFIGLEPLRFVVLWIALSPFFESNKKRFWRTILNWIPYLVVFGGFVFYRLFNSSAYSYQAGLFTELSSNPVQTILRLIGEVFWSTIDSTLTTWVNLIELLKRNMLSTVSISMVLLIVAGIGLGLLVLAKKDDGQKKAISDGKWMIWIGLAATVTAMAPFIVGSFKVTLDYPNNRYLIALAPGASLFLAGLIETLLHTDRQKLTTAAVLVGFAIGSQFMVARSYMLSWQAQQDFFWQLAWRAPQIERDTALVTYDLPFSDYYSGTSLTAPLNLIYSTESNGHQLPFMFLLTAQQKEVIKDYQPDQPLDYDFRSFEFSGNTSDVILLKKPADGCLQIVSPSDLPKEYSKKGEEEFWEAAIPLSNPGRIIPNPELAVTPSDKYFGKENTNQWCYFYEKADLERQQQDWQSTIQWYQDAETTGFSPQIESEWLPLIEANIHIGNAEKAVQITQEVVDRDTTNRAGFCRVWANAENNGSMLRLSEEMITWLNCRDFYDQ